MLNIAQRVILLLFPLFVPRSGTKINTITEKVMAIFSWKKRTGFFKKQ